MKHNLFILGIIAALTFSCSSDKIEETLMVDPNAVLFGVWDAVRLDVDTTTASDEVILGGIVLANLASNDCYILTFTFNQDLTYTVDNSVNYIDSTNPLSIPCPDQRDTDSSVFSYDGEVLTTVDGEGNTLMIDVAIEDNVMTVDATDVDIPSLNGSGSKLIFMKR